MKKMFNKGDVVICIKFDIEQKTMIDIPFEVIK